MWRLGNGPSAALRRRSWLLLPLVNRLQRDPAQQVDRNLAWKLALGLGAGSIAALWDRLVLTDLFNFSRNYRSTALFAVLGGVFRAAPAQPDSHPWQGTYMSAAVAVSAAITLFGCG